MPTESQHHRSPAEPHQARQIAESFGVDAERYDRARPRYPDALVQRVVTASPGREILDVGCGTGIAARQFQAAGCTVLGVDPDERMAEFARLSGVADGTTFTDEIAVADAHPAGARPFAHEQYVAKFRTLADGVIKEADQDQFLETVSRLAELDVAEVRGLALPAAIEATPATKGIF